MPTSRLPVGCACLGTPFPRHLCGRPVRRLKAGGGIIPSSSNPHPPFVERFLVLLRMCQHRPIVRRDELRCIFPSNQRSQSHFSRLNSAPYLRASSQELFSPQCVSMMALCLLQKWETLSVFSKRQKTDLVAHQKVVYNTQMPPGADCFSSLFPRVLSGPTKDKEAGGDGKTRKASAQPSGKRSPRSGAEGEVVVKKFSWHRKWIRGGACESSRVSASHPAGVVSVNPVDCSLETPQTQPDLPSRWWGKAGGPCERKLRVNRCCT
ncbi:uncharacterized protein LOC122692389 [Cervus elaphus]|uniref:uncharacterized protein LOC122692389 n=1 Tax=Cervus elaphus TaxID=9860 RepID=UPI001CC30A0C|nr:uncharacterized protein LOC122692389 [Cervus elaphus]